MSVIQDQYNQILQILGHTNAKGGTEGSGSQSNSAANANIVQDYASSTGNDIALIVGDKQQGWIIDSGATNHMTSLPTVLDYQQQVLSDKPRRVYLPNGDNVKVTHTGSCHLTSQDKIENVLLIPDFKFNLLSISKLTRDLNCVVSFFPDIVIFQDLYNGQVRGIGGESEGLYHLPIHKVSRDKHEQCFTAEENKETQTQSLPSIPPSISDSRVLLWHQRLGHTSPSVLTQVFHFPVTQCSKEVHTCRNNF